MIRVSIVIMLLVSFCLAQCPSPTPTPPKSEEQKLKEAKSEAERKAAEKLLPTALSGEIYKKYDSSIVVLMFLTYYRPNYRPSPNLPNENGLMEVCFDLREIFYERNSGQDILIEDARIIIDNREIPFTIPGGKIPEIESGWPAGKSIRRWPLRIMLTADQTLLLKGAKKISVSWNKGNFEVNLEGLKAIRSFFDKEIPISPPQK